jgi:hypothetical protein
MDIGMPILSTVLVRKPGKGWASRRWLWTASLQPEG